MARAPSASDGKTPTTPDFKPRYGTHVFGAEFWPGARPDPDDVADRLINRTSVKVFGLRRIGKSSLIAETRERLKSRDRRVIWIDLQKDDSLVGTLTSILAALHEAPTVIDRVSTWLNDTNVVPPAVKARLTAVIANRIATVTESDKTDIDAYAEALLEQIGLEFAQLADDDKPILIIDELPLLIINALQETNDADRAQTVARLNRFLAILRNWRSADVGVAMAICGSFSMAWLRREHGIVDEHLNDCEPLDIEELGDDEAKRLLEACIAVSKPKNWTKASANALVSILPATYPGVVQLAHNTIRYEDDTSAKAIKGDLRDKIERAIEGAYFTQFTRRFQRYSRDERDRAVRLFKALGGKGEARVDYDAAIAMLATDPNGEDDQSGRELFDLLSSDGFVTGTRRSGIRYTSGLAKAWRQD